MKNNKIFMTVIFVGLSWFGSNVVASEKPLLDYLNGCKLVEAYSKESDVPEGKKPFELFYNAEPGLFVGDILRDPVNTRQFCFNLGLSKGYFERICFPTSLRIDNNPKNIHYLLLKKEEKELLVKLSKVEGGSSDTPIVYPNVSGYISQQTQPAVKENVPMPVLSTATTSPTASQKGWELNTIYEPGTGINIISNKLSELQSNTGYDMLKVIGGGDFTVNVVVPDVKPGTEYPYVVLMLTNPKGSLYEVYTYYSVDQLRNMLQSGSTLIATLPNKPSSGLFSELNILQAKISNVIEQIPQHAPQTQPTQTNPFIAQVDKKFAESKPIIEQARKVLAESKDFNARADATTRLTVYLMAASAFFMVLAHNFDTVSHYASNLMSKLLPAWFGEK